MEEQDRTEKTFPEEEKDVEGHKAHGRQVGENEDTDEDSDEDVEAHSNFGAPTHPRPTHP